MVRSYQTYIKSAFILVYIFGLSGCKYDHCILSLPFFSQEFLSGTK